jgi:hypothetical protein
MQYTEATRRHINLVIFIFYLTMVFSGVLRKWFLPQLSSIIFFSSDLVAAYLYAYVLHKRLLPQNLLRKIALGIILFFGFLIIVQIFWHGNFLMILYGFRNYCFLIPMPIIMAEFMYEADVVRIAKWTCWFAIPSAYVVYLQYNSPPESFINKTVGLETKKIFTVVKDRVRTSGFFSFTQGQSLFTLTIFLSVFYAFFIEKTKRFFNPYLIVIFLFAGITNLAFSGSRTSYAYVFIVTSALVFSGSLLIRKSIGRKLIIFTLVGLISAIIIFPILFAENVSDMTERIENSSQNEGGILNRILTPIEVALAPLKHNLPIIGLGLGAETPGAKELKTNHAGVTDYGWFYESEWLRFIAEAGIVAGIVYLLFRFYLTYYMLKVSVTAVKYSGSPIPLLFSVAFAHIIFIGQMTFNGSTFVYGWFFLGISLAVSNIYLNEREVDELENE